MFLLSVAICILCLFLTVPWVGLGSVIVAFPDHTHFLSFCHFSQVLPHLTLNGAFGDALDIFVMMTSLSGR